MLNAPWEADVFLSGEDAARLIEAQFPELVPVRLERIGAGWDNDAYQVNGRWVFRFPRRQIAAALIEREADALPRLAPHLPLPVPTPVFAGVPGDGYPYPFAGYAHLSGTTACRIAWTDHARAANAALLAHFLATLHAVPVDDELRGRVPGDTIGRTDLAARAAQFKERLRVLAPDLPDLCPGHDAATLAALADRLARTPPHAGPPVIVHGDLYARHLLVADAAKTVCGVIDWGDVHIGDPALDLSLAFSFLPPGKARETFRVAYARPIDEPTWNRARFRALWYGAILTLYGGHVGDDALRSVGVYALQAATAADD